MSDDRNEGETGKFGTFGGVFTPNVLTILGVILFLRTGWVVGNAGLQQALVILLIANAITLLTTFSLSAIATNTRAGGGGAYYLISRSLGLEIGGSIGVPLYLAQSVSVAFYIVGFSESLRFLWPELDTRLSGSLVLLLLLFIAWIGAGLAIKVQYLILGLIGLSLVSFFLGAPPEAGSWRENLRPHYLSGHDFWSVFAIFFPAVTGITAGVSMSGDLKDPARSIPRGTLWAVTVCSLVYAAQMCWLAWRADRSDLVGDTLVMSKVARWGPLILVGLWAATLSSALVSLVAAPRTLQALARDRVLPRWLGQGKGARNEPRIALLLTAVVAGGCLLGGSLNLIAPVITLFFLTTYGMINLVAGLERWIHNPSWRPTYKVHWVPCLLGAMGCVFVMFLLSPPATGLAVLVCLGLYWLLKRRQYQTAWGDVRSGFWFAVARLGLLQLSRSRSHVKNWRPVFLVLAGNPKSRLHLIALARWMEADRGLLFLAQILTGDWEKLLRRQAKQQESIEAFIQENRIAAVAQTILAQDFEHGVTTLLQVAGVGSLQPNTVLMGWSEDEVKQATFRRTVRRILELHSNLILHAEPDLPSHQLEPIVDVWWRARENGSLMLTLAHLLSTQSRWRDYSIRVRRIIEEEAGQAAAAEGMTKMLAEARIRAEVEILVSERPPLEVIGEASERSEFCFAGLTIQAEGDAASMIDRYDPLVQRLKGNVLFTKSWHDLEL